MTIKQLFPKLSDKHRLWLGRSIASSYKVLIGVPANQVNEHGLMVNDYPETFKIHIDKIFKRFCKKVDVTPRKKRIRIKRFEKVQPKPKGNDDNKIQR